jgi:hypothetical protein
LKAAGLSLSLAGGASAATGAPVADALIHNAVMTHEINLAEEEIADVSLATAPRGRADDFFWPRADTSGAADMALPDAVPPKGSMRQNP